MEVGQPFMLRCRFGEPMAMIGHASSLAIALKPKATGPDTVGSMEVTTTNGEFSVAHAVGDGVKIRIRPNA